MSEPLTPERISAIKEHVETIRQSLPGSLIDDVYDIAADWQRLHDENRRLNGAMDTMAHSLEFLGGHNDELHAENAALRRQIACHAERIAAQS